MFQRLDRYLIGRGVLLFLGFLGLACSILLIERLVRLTEILSGAENPAFNAVRLISRLLPHYIELALPGALLLTTILTINRLSRSGEIVAMLSSGISLYRIARPFVIISVILATLSILSSGYLKPLTRYNFRAVVNELGQDNLVAAFQDFKFLQFDNWTIWTSGIDTKSMKLGETFIFETTESGTERFMIGGAGTLEKTPESGWVISLEDAMIGDLPEQIEDGKSTHVSARKIDWQMPLDQAAFRSRGLDERELTLTELLTRSYQNTEFEVNTTVATADLHDRLARGVLLVSLAFSGVFLGLNLGRNVRSGGLVTGILLLLVVQKLLEFGLLKAQQGTIPSWAGSWPVIVVLTVSSLYFFNRANGAQHFRFGLVLKRSSPFSKAAPAE
ncbi:MAG: LptF/LptG family permease [Pseudomonadota bacterium]